MQDLAIKFLSTMNTGVIRIEGRVPVDKYAELVLAVSSKVRDCYSNRSDIRPSIEMGMQPVSMLIDTLGITKCNFE